MLGLFTLCFCCDGSQADVPTRTELKIFALFLT